MDLTVRAVTVRRLAPPADSIPTKLKHAIMKNDKIYLVLETFKAQSVVRAFSAEELQLECANRILKNFWEKYADKITDCSKDELIEEKSGPGDYLVRIPEGETVYKLFIRTIGLDDDVKYDFTL